MKKKLPTVVELFAGAGIFGSAFAYERFRLQSAVELNLQAAETYRMNLGDHVFVGDIRNAHPQGRADVLIAGPPCQGFSTLGKRNKRDPRNRLSLHVLRWLDVVRPKIVVIENVPQFLQSSQAKTIQKRLLEKGYHVSTGVLDAFDYGVPQHRQRAILIASKVGGIRIAKPRYKVTKVKDAWLGLPSEPNGENHHDFRMPSALAEERMKSIPLGGDKRDLLQDRPDLCPPSWESTRSEVTDIWGRMTWDAPSNTLRTCFLNPSKGRYIHPEQNRVISIREGARLQTIPDTFQFAGTPYQIACQIGNSVPFTLGRCIARAVRRRVA